MATVVNTTGSYQWNFVTQNIAVSGSIYSPNQSLILSSSSGSIVSFSSSLDFPNSDKNYHVRAVNSNLIFSSSAGSIIALSASEDFVNSDTNYHIRAVNSPLILSSSSNSLIHISGTLSIGGLTSSMNPLVGPGTTPSALKVSRENGFWGITIEGSGTNQADLLMYVSGGTQNEKTVQHLVTSTSRYIIRTLNDNVTVNQNLLTCNLSNSFTVIGSASTVNSAKLAIAGTDGAFLLPRLTDAQKAALQPTAGMMIYNTTSGSFQVYTTAWKIITVT